MIWIYSPLPSLLILAGVLGLAATRLFRLTDAPPQQARHENTIDGLRGFLALGVVLHHAVIYRRYLLEGVWDLPASTFYVLIGQLGIATFFMVTAYLFWGRVSQRGVRWPEFYVGRIFRIGPLYLGVLAVVVVIVLAAADFQLLEPLKKFEYHLAVWAALGAGAVPDINRYPQTYVLLAGVTWSLRYEWGFYAVLPVLALARRWTLILSCLTLAGALIMTALHPSHDRGLWSCTALFGAGMTAASLPPARLSNRLLSGLAILIGLAFLFCQTAYSPLTILLAGAAFYLIASGSDLFGLLATKAALRLGNISYGIYLMQGLALAAVLRPEALKTFALSGAMQYWTCIAAATVLLSVVAMVTHVAIERPFIAMGKFLTGLPPFKPRARKAAQAAT